MREDAGEIRRISTAAVALMLAATLSAGAASAAVKVGTNGADALVGTNGADALVGTKYAGHLTDKRGNDAQVVVEGGRDGMRGKNGSKSGGVDDPSARFRNGDVVWSFRTAE